MKCYSTILIPNNLHSLSHLHIVWDFKAGSLGYWSFGGEKSDICRKRTTKGVGCISHLWPECSSAKKHTGDRPLQHRTWAISWRPDAMQNAVAHAQNDSVDRKMATATGTEWQQARQWLLEARVIPVSHPATKPTAQLIDFANCLRDGVYLCALLNRLVPRSVPHYHPRATLQVKCVPYRSLFILPRVAVRSGFVSLNLVQCDACKI